MPRRRSRTRRKIKGRGGAAVADSRRTSITRLKGEKSTDSTDSTNSTNSTDSTNMSLVAEELKSSLKENDNQLLAIIDKTGEWVDKHPKEANQILTYLEQKIKSQRGGGQRGGSQRGGNVHYGPDGVDMNEMSLPLILVMAMEVISRIPDSRSRMIFATIVVAVFGVGYGIGTAFGVGMMLAAAGAAGRRRRQPAVVRDRETDVPPVLAYDTDQRRHDRCLIAPESVPAVVRHPRRGANPRYRSA